MTLRSFGEWCGCTAAAVLVLTAVLFASFWMDRIYIRFHARISTTDLEAAERASARHPRCGADAGEKVESMSRCPMCGQEAGTPRIAHYRDMGFDPLEHCLFAVLYEEKVKPCIGKSPKIGRQCELCPRSKQYGHWEVSRGKQAFISTKEEPDDRE